MKRIKYFFIDLFLYTLFYFLVYIVGWFISFDYNWIASKLDTESNRGFLFLLFVWSNVLFFLIRWCVNDWFKNKI
ncbi:hypothetical protein Phi19:1_gp059 [Cellulophaga phage phi19:1]|uniref:Transmembrane protein n=1 Tax=Cellulophaga phage phi19:1 TaxID=1327970 RepID=R9ZVX7_9CAUD|nr:hypothetical protein Phi19:1_gp059 [Cellulophaga phage phi19:1]AGO47349.1 hypothetical protein Phi19:1_gp059 [Cellulophaga phage phi19:1]